MAKRVEIKLNRKNVSSQLLKGSGTVGMIEGLARDKATEAGGGYLVTTFLGKNRVTVQIEAASERAYYDNLDNNTLNKVVGV